MSVDELLETLDYPNRHTTDLSRSSDIVTLVSWLEDRKIRELAVEDRDNLRVDGPKWTDAIQRYLANLGCPWMWQTGCEADCINWLLSYAISKEYEDVVDTVAQIEESSPNQLAMETDELPKTKADIDSISSKIDELGALIYLERLSGESDSNYLQRISRKIRLSLTPGSIKSLIHAEHQQDEISALLTEFPLGFTASDEELNHVILVLKMLYVEDFRELQNDLNALVVLGQSYTANPRTNTKLGKVGH